MADLLAIPEELSSLPPSPSPQESAEPTWVEVPEEAEVARGKEVAVTVAVRARPLLAKERAEGSRSCVVADSVRKEVLVGADRLFSYTCVLGPEASQGDVYHKLSVRSLVKGLLDGYNATVFAYGQTGSGKTYTMGIGSSTGWGEGVEQGIVPRVVQDLFAAIHDHQAAHRSSRVSVRCQFLEIYNEEVRDLLSPATSARDVAIREGPSGRVVVSGAATRVAKSEDDLARILEEGTVARTTGATNMNVHSSRSHAILTVLVERTERGGGEVVVGKMHLVDLAGSERQKKTGAVGSRFRESVAINQGLLALGNVISALSGDARYGRRSARSQGAHVPYRQSKLTRLLQDSLGGNSRTVMVACVSVTDGSMEETLSTLKYAARAMRIRNRVEANRESVADAIAQIQGHAHAAEIDALRKHLQDPLKHPPPDALYSALGPEMAELIIEHIRASPSPSSAQPSTSQPSPSPGDGAGGEPTPLRPLQLGTPVAGQGTPMPPDVAAMGEELERARADLERTRRDAAALVGDVNRLRAENDVLRARLARAAREGHEGALDDGGQVPGTPAALTAVAVGSAVPAGDGDERPRTALARLQHLQGMRWSRAMASGDLARLAKSAAGPGDGANLTVEDLQELVAVKDNQLRDTQARLQEAVEDLERDEAIFAEKMRDFKAVKKAAKRMSKENEVLRERVRALESVVSATPDKAGATGMGGASVASKGTSKPATKGAMDDDSVVLAPLSEADTGLGESALGAGPTEGAARVAELEAMLAAAEADLTQLQRVEAGLREELAGVRAQLTAKQQGTAVAAGLLASEEFLFWVREAASEASASQGLSATQQQTRDRLAAVRAELLACGAARLELQLKRERRKRALEDQVQELSQAMAELEEEAESMRGRAEAGDPVAEVEVAALRAQEEDAIAARAEAQAALREGRFLADEDEAALRETEDRLDALKAEAAWLEREEEEGRARGAVRERAGEELRSRLQATGFADLLEPLVRATVAAEAKALEAGRAAENRTLDLEVRLAEAQQEARDLRAALQARESEHKREAEAAKARHAEHLRQVMSQVGAEARDRSATPRVSEDPSDGLGKLRVDDLRKLLALYKDQVEMLGKDNAYFKATNRELKRRLRREQVAVDAAQAEVDRGARAADSLRASNRALAAELRGAITELRASRAHGVGQEGGRAEGRGAADGVKGDRRRVEGGTNAGGWGVWGEDGSRDMGRGGTRVAWHEDGTDKSAVGVQGQGQGQRRDSSVGSPATARQTIHPSNFASPRSPAVPRRYNAAEFHDADLTRTVLETTADVTRAEEGPRGGDQSVFGARGGRGDRGRRESSGLAVDTSDVNVDTSVDEMDRLAEQAGSLGMRGGAGNGYGHPPPSARSQWAMGEGSEASLHDRPPSRTPSLSPYLTHRTGTASSHRSDSTHTGTTQRAGTPADPLFEFDVTRLRRLQATKTVKLERMASEVSSATPTPRQAPQSRAAPPMHVQGVGSGTRTPHASPSRIPHPATGAARPPPAPPKSPHAGRGPAPDTAAPIGMSSDVLLGSPVRIQLADRAEEASMAARDLRDEGDASHAPKSPLRTDRLKKLAEARRVTSARAHGARAVVPAQDPAAALAVVGRGATQAAALRPFSAR